MAMKMYVGGLSYNTTNSGLESLFAEFGEVLDTKVITDRDTGRSKGFGFVEMTNSEDAKNAMDSLNGSSFDGRTIVVNEARPQEKRSRY